MVPTSLVSVWLQIWASWSTTAFSSSLITFQHASNQIKTLSLSRVSVCFVLISIGSVTGAGVETSHGSGIVVASSKWETTTVQCWVESSISCLGFPLINPYSHPVSCCISYYPLELKVWKSPNNNTKYADSQYNGAREIQREQHWCRAFFFC